MGKPPMNSNYRKGNGPDRDRHRDDHQAPRNQRDDRLGTRGPPKDKKGKEQSFPPGHPHWKRSEPAEGASSSNLPPSQASGQLSSQASGQHLTSTAGGTTTSPSSPQVHMAGGKRGHLSTGSSMEHIPAKKVAKGTFANVAEQAQGKDALSYSTQWKEHDLRVFRSDFSQLTISRNDYDDLSAKLVKFTYGKLKEDPGLRLLARAHQQYYQQELQCGVIECCTTEAAAWYKQVITTLTGGAFRGWMRDEKANAFIKIFVPPAFQDLTGDEYFDSASLFYPTFPNDKWKIHREYTQKRKPGEPGKPTRVLIAEVTPKTLGYLRHKSSYANNGVWKLPGMLSSMKFAMAREIDLKGQQDPPAHRTKESVEVSSQQENPAQMDLAAPLLGTEAIASNSPMATMDSLRLDETEVPSSAEQQDLKLLEESDDEALHTLNQQPPSSTDWSEEDNYMATE